MTHYQYAISYSQPNKKLFSIELSLKTLGREVIKVAIPAWRPGRYELQNYAQNILAFSARDAEGNNLFSEKIDRNTWQISDIKSKEIKIRYQYFAHTLDAGGSWLDENLCYINPINLCLYDVENIENAGILDLLIDNQYKIATGLGKAGENRFQFSSYYELADCPILASKSLQTISFEHASIPVFIHFQKEILTETSTLIAQFRGFFESQLALFQHFPEKEYHFLIIILPYLKRHGVEHRNSTVITMGPESDFDTEAFQTQFLSISSHELFHTWNICKIRPKEMLPYRLGKENYFPTGFVAEGFTTYYGDLMLLRSGVFSSNQFFEEFAQNINAHMSNNARNSVSLYQSSIDLWVDGYKPSHGLRKVSIYDKGALVAFMLDIEIRKSTQNKHSLDDIMRILYSKYLSTGYLYSDIVAIAQDLGFKDAALFFENFIKKATPIELSLSRCLDYIGIRLLAEQSHKTHLNKFGFDIYWQSGKAMVNYIESGSPADKMMVVGSEMMMINNKKLSPESENIVFENVESINITYQYLGMEYTKTMITNGGSYGRKYILKAESSLEQDENFNAWAKG